MASAPTPTDAPVVKSRTASSAPQPVSSSKLKILTLSMSPAIFSFLPHLTPLHLTLLPLLGWNMGNARADEFGRVIPQGGGDYDIIVLGLQEATWSIQKEKRKSVETMGSQAEDDPKKSELDCVRQLLSDLGEVLGPTFPLVVRNRRVQMQQMVYAREAIRNRITNIEKFAENTGFFHVFPNKVSLSFYLPFPLVPISRSESSIGRPPNLIYNRSN
jgi:hypothetical protein